MTPDPIEPDTKDWTWVLSRACPECGFDPASAHHTEVAERIRGDADDWVSRLNGPDVRTRRQPNVWSTLEYGCHVRDVHRIFNHRVRLMLTEDEPQFPNWDQDETAIADDYASREPTTVATELFDAANIVAEHLHQRARRRVDTARLAEQRQRIQHRDDLDLPPARHRPPRPRRPERLTGFESVTYAPAPLRQ